MAHTFLFLPNLLSMVIATVTMVGCYAHTQKPPTFPSMGSSASVATKTSAPVADSKSSTPPSMGSAASVATKTSAPVADSKSSTPPSMGSAASVATKTSVPVAGSKSPRSLNEDPVIISADDLSSAIMIGDLAGLKKKLSSVMQI